MERNFPIQCADFDRLVTDSVEGVRVEVSGMPDLSDSCLYADREYSWLQFNERVLEEALDERNPLLERVKFLSIFGSNLDEFFMVRVSGVQKRITEGAKEDRIDELAQEQLQIIRGELLRQLPLNDSCWNESLEPALREKGIKVLNYFELSGEDREKLRDYFERNIFPLLTPLGFDSGHPFPHISNLSLNLAVLIDDPDYGERFARVKIPPMFSRLIVVPEDQEKITSSFEELKIGRFVWLEQLIAANLDLLFPGQRILGAYPFRITRDADLGFDEDGDKDLLTAVKQRVGRNYFGPAVRLETDYTMPERVSEILLKNLDLTPPLMFRSAAPLGLSSLMKLAQINRPELKYAPFKQRKHSRMADKEKIFSALKKKDILLCHPYDSFESVTDLVEEAADDPDVLAIKMTLYRVDDNSRIIQALMKAADRSKQVAVLVELKARFDEENNIGWAKELERKGVHVAYGFPGRKIHAKMCLIVRAEKEGGIRYYVHMSTGNYNAVTGKLYTDCGYLTSDHFIGKDISDLFNALTGYSRKDHYIKLLVAPQTMRHQILERIRREIDMHEKFGNGHLIFKMNSLVDYQCIRELYRASRVGVKVDLIIRGICCLRPGIYGLSENIRVVSIVGRFLEHSRVYYFRNGGKEEVFMGSADLMPRNLDNRVEVLFPVSSDYIPIVRDIILGTHLKDNIKARLLLPNGRTERIYPQHDEEELDSQLWMLENRGSWDIKTEEN